MLVLFSDKICLATEKILSDAALLAGVDNILQASLYNKGNVGSCKCHHLNGSKFFPKGIRKFP